MKRETIIKFRTTEKEYEHIKKAAKREHTSVSEYVRTRVNVEITDKWIKKKTVQQRLSCIANVLDKNEEKNMRMTQQIREEVMKLWNQI